MKHRNLNLEISQGYTRYSHFVIFYKVKIKLPYLTSVAQKSHLTNKHDADGALILWVFQAT